ncbi:adhesion G protein-coupled receptor G3 [Danio rerio]|uniref:Adhesion G protein-coupled receptor G11 n=9 Tax=Danio rerio TaxID=7955 RepID=F1R9B1_DANRE|nr:adhesion G-protein coupled receptor G2 [Danio rerio]|eukprot:XP_017208200.1 adhesion G-protein coupled receptor G2 [Danio rerio]
MKWKTIGLLLILPALISADSSNHCSSDMQENLANMIKNNKNSPDMMDFFIFGADGFVGYMKSGTCKNGAWDPSPGSSQCNLSDWSGTCRKDVWNPVSLSELCRQNGDAALTVLTYLQMNSLQGTCKNGTWVPSPSSSRCNLTGQSEKNSSICVFPIDGSSTSENATIFRSDLGVSFPRKDTAYTDQYQLNISRSVLPTIVCLIGKDCRNVTWANWITGNNCSWTKQTTTSFNNNTCNVTCLNTKKACETASYNPSCSDDNSNNVSNKMNTFEINGGSAACIKCGNPFQPAQTITLPAEITEKFNQNDTKTVIDAGAAASAMKDLSSMLSYMGNLTVASVSMGSVKGILKKIQSESEVTETAFIYSPATGVRLIDDPTVLKNYPNALIVPKEAAQQALNQSSNAFLGVFRFPNMSKDANNSDVLNNEVYAIEMGTKIKNLSNTINLSFNMSQSTSGTPTCYSWDGNGSKPDWTTEGCRTVVNGSGITCKCEHLTFFAVLMAPPDITLRESDLTALTYITYIGCGLSMFFLGVGLFMHFLMRKAKATNSVHVLINLFLALFMLNVAFLTNEYVVQAQNSILCRVMAAFLHYCLLSSFTWFAVEALHLCLQMTKTATLKHYLLKITVAGWAPPAFVVSVIFSLGKYGEDNIMTESRNVTMCWIVDSTVHYVVNIGYYCFVFTFTLGTFIVVVRWLSMLRMSKWSKDGKVKRSGTATSDISTMLGLCCLLGLTWGISFFSYGALRMPSYYIFTILNSLQGFFLFVYYLKTSTFFGDSAPSEKSEKTEVTDNPYEDAT